MIDYSVQNKRAWEYNAYEFWVKQFGTPSERAKRDIENPLAILGAEVTILIFQMIIRDILFNTEEFVFSYRVGGLLIKNNKILLQKPKNDDLDNESIDLDFCWVPLEELKIGLKIYPLELIPHILNDSSGIVHFVSKQI